MADKNDKPLAEDWSLPGKYGEIFRDVEKKLHRFRKYGVDWEEDED